MGIILKNAPIIEAVCEFKFVTPFEDLTIYGTLGNSLKDKFPKKRIATRLDVALENADGKIQQRIIEQKLQQFLSEDEKTLVQIGPDILTINMLKPYQNWDIFYSCIKMAFDSTIKNGDTYRLKRIGLRYINKINLNTTNLDLDEHFNLTPQFDEEYFGPDVGSYIVGVQFPRQDNRDLLKISLSNTIPDPDFKMAHTLDIDYFILKMEGINEGEAIDWVATAHDEVEKAFLNIVSPKLLKDFE